AEGLAVVIGAAPIPFAVPAFGFERRFQPLSVRAPRGRARLVAALGGEGGEVAQRLAQEPAEPDAGAAAVLADAVHAVVPVAAEDQRQAVLPGAGNGKVERA